MHQRERSPLAPSRRSLAGLLAAGAVLAVPAVATAAPMPDPDAGLIALGRELEAAWADERHAIASCGDDDDDAIQHVLDTACERTSAVVERIEVLTAFTLTGLRVKLRALDWTHNGDTLDAADLFGREDCTTDDRLVAAILADLRTITA